MSFNFFGVILKGCHTKIDLLADFTRVRTIKRHKKFPAKVLHLFQTTLKVIPIT